MMKSSKGKFLRLPATSKRKKGKKGEESKGYEVMNFNNEMKSMLIFTLRGLFQFYFLLIFFYKNIRYALDYT